MLCYVFFVYCMFIYVHSMFISQRLMFYVHALCSLHLTLCSMHPTLCSILCVMFLCHHVMFRNMLHTLYKGITVQNIEKAVHLLYYLSEEDMNCLVQVDCRIKNFPVQQSINLFSKKTVFYQGK